MRCEVARAPLTKIIGSPAARGKTLIGGIVNIPATVPFPVDARAMRGRGQCSMLSP